MDNKIIISICINTYKRTECLKQCLNSILRQFKNENIQNKVEVIILNDNASDRTSKMILSYLKKYRNIRYFENKVRVGIIKGILQGATYAKGNYIWFFSDDDLFYNNSIDTILKIIKKFKPDTILCNSDQFDKDINNLVSENKLKISKDLFFHTKKEFFTFLEKKFPFSINWFLYSLSSTVLKKNIFSQNKKLIDKYNEYADMSFPVSVLIYYTNRDYKQYILSKSVLSARIDNFSWQKNDSLKTAILFDQSQTDFFKKICKINGDNVSMKFKLLVLAKGIIRKIYIILTKLMNILNISSNVRKGFFSFFKS